MDQVHEYENLVAEILAEGMKMCEILQANVLIEKLPESWSDYRNCLKHKKRDMTLEDLVSHMKIEEANRLKDNVKKPNNELAVKANLVETHVNFDKNAGGDQSNKNQKLNFKKKGRFGQKGKFVQKGMIEKKNTGKCYSCGKEGHFAYQCPNKKEAGKQANKGKSNNQAHLAETDDVIADVIFEANLVENYTEWIVDTGASKTCSLNLIKPTRVSKSTWGIRAALRCLERARCS